MNSPIIKFVGLLISGAIIIKYLMDHRSKMVVENPENLDPNAKILGTHSEHDRMSKNIKTIVYFSDGSEFHTFKTTYAVGLLHSSSEIKPEFVELIKEMAFEAHQKEVEMLD